MWNPQTEYNWYCNINRNWKTIPPRIYYWLWNQVCFASSFAHPRESSHLIPIHFISFDFMFVFLLFMNVYSVAFSVLSALHISFPYILCKNPLQATTKPTKKQKKRRKANQKRNDIKMKSTNTEQLFFSADSLTDLSNGWWKNNKNQMYTNIYLLYFEI